MVMTQEEKEELARLVHKLCNEDGWKMYFQSVRLPIDEGGDVYAEKDADFGYSNRIILEPPENFE